LYLLCTYIISANSIVFLSYHQIPLELHLLDLLTHILNAVLIVLQLGIRLSKPLLKLSLHLPPSMHLILQVFNLLLSALDLDVLLLDFPVGLLLQLSVLIVVGRIRQNGCDFCDFFVLELLYHLAHGRSLIDPVLHLSFALVQVLVQTSLELLVLGLKLLEVFGAA
jgi:hypothetical protein